MNKRLSFLVVVIILVISNKVYSTDTIQFKRKCFNYYEIVPVSSDSCFQNTDSLLNLIYSYIDMNRSEKALEISEEALSKNPLCPHLSIANAEANFRNGKWEESVDLIDAAIIKFGSRPEIISSRSRMNLEMAELGTGVRNVDGNGVYKKTYYSGVDEQHFKKENYNAALSDLLYLIENYDGLDFEKLTVAYLYQRLEDFENSNLFFEEASKNPQFSDQAKFLMIENCLATKNFEKAQEILDGLIVAYPKNTELYKKQYMLFDKTGNEEKKKESEQLYYFYNWIPESLDISYNDSVYNLLKSFAEGVESGFLGIDSYDSISNIHKKELVNKLKKINDANSVKILISVLHMHMNHGNGVESEIRSALESMNKEYVVESASAVFAESSSSTCTLSSLAFILANSKDPSVWDLLKESLKFLDNCPMTLIPPTYPEAIIAFDVEKGTELILQKLRDKDLNLRYMYIYPLKKVKKSIVKKHGKVLYSKAELEELFKEIRD